MAVDSINMEMNATTQKPVVIPTVNSLNKLQWEKKKSQGLYLIRHTRVTMATS